MIPSALFLYTSLVGTAMTVTCLGRGMLAAGTRLLKGQPKEAAAELAQGIVDPAMAVGEAVNYLAHDAAAFGREVTAKSRQTWASVWARARASIGPATPAVALAGMEIPVAAHAVCEDSPDAGVVASTIPTDEAPLFAESGTEPAQGLRAS